MTAIRCPHLIGTLPLALLGMLAIGCVPKIVPAAGAVDMKLEIVLENLRPAKIQLVTDPSLGKVFTGKMTLLEKNGKIPVPKEFLNNLDAFYEILEVRDKSGRKLLERESAASGELAFDKGFGYNLEGAFLIIKKK